MSSPHLSNEQQPHTACPHLRSSNLTSSPPLSVEQPYEQPTPVQGTAAMSSSLTSSPLPSKSSSCIRSWPPFEEQQPHEQPAPIRGAAAKRTSHPYPRISSLMSIHLRSSSHMRRPHPLEEHQSHKQPNLI
uniref:Uncharacterized protein n=1 Tax=Myotis myotis TaxID=51298 RepID=A0A7J7YET0_MYOMY|nr:hypothetical protein mMyoMyo1_011094 [Myotis myotis]